MTIIQNKFAFFSNFAETIKELPESKQAEAYKAICEYGIYGILPEDESLRMMCLMAKASIFKEDGRKNNGGNHNPTGKNQHQKQVNLGQSGSIQVNSGQFLSKQETETETETEKGKEKEIDPKCDFTPPTEEEVMNYAKQQNAFAGVGGFRCTRPTAEQFYSHYDSQHWITGSGIPIRNWKAKLKEWCSKQTQKEQKELND